MRVAGLGFRGAADLASLHNALQKALDAAGEGPLDALVTESAKSRASVFRELSSAMRLPGLGIRTEDLSDMITPTQSDRIRDQFGTGSLCEAAALAAAGPRGRLLSPRVISDDGMATAAIAESLEGKA